MTRLLTMACRVALAAVLLVSCTDSSGTPSAEPSVAETSAAPASKLPIAEPADIDIPAGGLEPATGALDAALGVASDPGGDSQKSGDVPAWTEVVQAGVRGRGKEVDLILVLSGPVPQPVPEKEYMIVAWNLAAAKEAPTVGISAEAGPEGWVVSSSVDNKIVDYPGQLTIEGDKIVLTMPWGFVGGPHAFDWSTAATWLSQSGKTPSSSADNITDGHYPPKRKG